MRESLSPQERIAELAHERAGAQGLEIVDIELTRRGRGFKVAIAVDQAGGVGIEECAAFSRDLSGFLEQEPALVDLVVELEVGSPGLTRPLRKPQDFERFKGRLALLNLNGEVAGRQQYRGRLVGYDAAADLIRLDAAGQLVEIPRARVARARLDFDFSQPGRRG